MRFRKSWKTVPVSLLLLVLVACGSNGPASQGGQAEAVEPPIPDGAYNATGDSLGYGSGTGYFAEPADRPRPPALILVHSDSGLNDHVRVVADKLATNGYRTLAVDLYNGTEASPSEQDVVQHLAAATQYLSNIGSQTVGVVGIGDGGHHAMRLAGSDYEADATVVLYGTPVAEQADGVDDPLRAIYGLDDEVIKIESVQSLEDDLETEQNQSVSIYDEVGHGFTNPSAEGYDESAGRAAWNETLSFLATHIGN